MGIRELETFYESSLHPVFGAQLRIIYERNDFVHIILDGEKEEVAKLRSIPEEERYDYMLEYPGDKPLTTK